MKKHILLFFFAVTSAMVVIAQTQGATKYRATASAEISQEDLEKKTEVRLFPNPASDKITIDLGMNNSGEIKLYYLSGSEAYRETLYSAETTVDISSLRDGLYFYEIYSNGRLIMVGKVIKK